MNNRVAQDEVEAGAAVGNAIATAVYGNQSAPIEPADGLALVVQRLAENPSVDVDKLERIIQLQERILRLNAEASFNEAFARMQPKIPVILEKKKGDGDKWRYAPLEDIVEPLRPILAEFGFSLSHETQWPDAQTVKVIGILTHKDGHSRRSEFQSAADKSGSKNAIQALGSSVSYGKRYTTSDLLCIVTRGEDDNGKNSEKGNQPESPDGYDDWLSDMTATADEGMPAFSVAWNKSPEAFRNYLAKTAPKMLASLRTKAGKVKA